MSTAKTLRDLMLAKAVFQARTIQTKLTGGSDTAQSVKVQRALSSSAETPPWLISKKGHKPIEIKPELIVPAAVQEAMGTDARAYFRARWNGHTKSWSLLERTSDKQGF